ncbi:MAG: CvpA family protein [candidate division Zixibacteria bacterium]|nr:CvpA family protein [candidate division Zixibacteria bacterium]
MNWIDAVLLVLLLISVIIGSKKGLIRELMAFLVFAVAIVISVNYIDNFAVWVYNQLGGSPLISAFLSFIILIAFSYALFKLLGILFYKVATVKDSGRRDQMGGALIGFLRGWLAIGLLTLLVFLLPMPNSFYTAFEASFLGATVAKTVPLLYEGTSFAHPKNTKFITKIENTLLDTPITSSSGTDMSEERAEVFRVMRQFDLFFNISSDES